MQNSSAFQFLALDTIHESAANPRRTFEESKLHELAESIRQHGLIQPITVRPNSEGFEIEQLRFFKRPARISGGLVDGVDGEVLECAAVLHDCPPWAG